MGSPKSSRWPQALYSVIAIAVVISLAILVWRDVVRERELASAFLAMLGTFLGALLAFRLNEHKDAIKLAKDQKENLNQALFIVIRQYNSVRFLQKELAGYKDDFTRAFNAPALRPSGYDDLLVDFSSIAFLLDNDPNILMRLSVEQEGFHQTLESVRIRSEFLVKEVQPEIGRLGLNRKKITHTELQEALGERLTMASYNYARIMYSMIDSTVEGLLKLHGDLFAAAKKVYPDAKFIKPAPAS